MAPTPWDAISTVDAKLMGTPEFSPIYDTIQRLESFHTMAHDKEILGVAESLLGEPAMPQPSTIARVMFASGGAHTTPPHQDFVLVQGTPEVWTCWIPLGACPRSMGGLAVLRGSHTRGRAAVCHSRWRRRDQRRGRSAWWRLVLQSVRLGGCAVLSQQDRPELV